MNGSRRREYLKNIDYIKKSKAFLFPMLNTAIYHQKTNTKGEFILNHLIDVGFIQMGFPQIVVIFDNVDYIPLKEDVHRLSMSYCYVGSEYGDEDREVCMFFDIPKEFRKDFELFTQGKYSEFSSGYKDLLVKTYGSRRDEGVSPKTGLPNINIYNAIYPTEALRKLLAKQLSTDNAKVDWNEIDEVLSPPNIELEEFKTIEELI